MKKIIFIVVFIVAVQQTIAQRTQLIAYIDVDYILDNIPDYVAAQKALDAKALTWRNELTKQQGNIDALKIDLANEKAILTTPIIKEREEDIQLKQEELARLELLYFGPDGSLFNLRKQLIRPIQDQIYNAVQDIAKKMKYDFVINKSNELTMLYFNKKYDISELVLATLVKGIKLKENEAIIDAKQAEKIEKIEAAKKKRMAKIELQKQAIKLAREKKLKEKEAKIKALQKKKDSLKKENQELKKRKNN